jgi:hypothetical protein
LDCRRQIFCQPIDSKREFRTALDGRGRRFYGHPFRQSDDLALPDHHGLFNPCLEGNARRAIDIHERETIDGEALKDLVEAACALNRSKKTR